MRTRKAFSLILIIILLTAWLVNPNSKVNAKIASPSIQANGFVSDDFNPCGMKNGVWTQIDPLQDATFTTDGKKLIIDVPGGDGHDHDIWGTGPTDFKYDAPRIMQAIPNTDFGIEVKIDSAVTAKWQTQGIIVEQDNLNLVRFELHFNGVNTIVYPARIVNGQGIKESSATITGSPSPLYMRVVRAGDQWTVSYSMDGAAWIPLPSFTDNLSVTKAGIYAGNTKTGPDVPPAHTGIFDYVFNLSSPVSPINSDTNSLKTNVAGNGSVSVSPQKAQYSCGEKVTIQASPADGWNFYGWTGDLTGAQNPTVVTMSNTQNVTAQFSQNGVIPPTGGNILYLPTILR